MTRAFWLILASAAGVHGASLAADSARGTRLFETLSCVQCHSINGSGGKVGPDLGRRIDRAFTPATLAATMWNHAPAMWSAMKERSVQAGNLDEQAAMDLFAYFYSAHFFDRLGDAGRGKQAFNADHCVECHGVTGSKGSEEKTVVPLPAVGRPIELVDAMWNHAATMKAEFAKRKLKWPELTSQDLADILVYLRNQPATREQGVELEITAGSNGAALFASKGCQACHAGGLGAKLKGKTLEDIAVDMWNHAPKMAASAPELSTGEMREILSYLWAEQFFEDSGNASAGERVFVAKQCASCHKEGSGPAPNLVRLGKTYTGATMVSALWHHGPTMLNDMKAKGIAWPRFEGQEMANLIAYLNSGSRGAGAKVK